MGFACVLDQLVIHAVWWQIYIDAVIAASAAAAAFAPRLGLVVGGARVYTWKAPLAPSISMCHDTRVAFFSDYLPYPVFALTAGWVQDGKWPLNHREDDDHISDGS